MFDRCLILICALAVVIGIAGCDKQQAVRETDEDARESKLQQRPFTWRDAAQSTPEEAREVLGAYEGCEPNKQLPSPTPENRLRWLSRPPYCHFKEADDALADAARHPTYRIRDIAYSSGEAAIVSLVPRRKMALSEASLEAFDLPELPVEQHVWPNPPAAFRHAIQYRAADAQSAPDGVLGIEAVGTEEDKEQLGSIRIFLKTSDGMTKQLLGRIGPEVASQNLVLPVTTANLRPIGGAYAEIGREHVRLGIPQQYPALGNTPGDASRREFATAELDEDGGSWKTKFEAYIQKEKEKNEKLNQAFDRTLSISADHLTPAVALRRLMTGAKDVGIGRFKLLGRNVAPAKVQQARYGVPMTTNMTLDTSPSSTQAQPGVNPRLLTLELGLEGINLSTARQNLPPAPGCPDAGPTLCLRSKIDLAAKFEEARALQAKGELDKSHQIAQAALDAYDWTGLYNKLVAIDRRFARESVIRIRLTDDQVPVAALMRVMDVARNKVRTPTGEESDCADELSDELAWTQMLLCATARGPVPIFEHPVLLGAEN